MEYHVYHDFMVHTKGVAYVMMGLILCGAVGWWLFLTGKEPKDKSHH